MKKFMLDLTVKENLKLNRQYVLLKLTNERPLPEMLPGQFAEVRVDGSPSVFLRRPISINFVDYEKNELWLLIQIVGEGTRQMAQAKQGDTMNLLLPLGNTFTLPADTTQKLLLVGGGVGVAPLLFFGAYADNLGYDCSFLLGARSKEDLLQLEEFERYGKVHITTNDGTQGEKGFVTQHSVLNTGKADRIYTCGPTPMMKAVAKYAAENDIPCEVSLENTMACGIGTCLCCVTDTDQGNVCVCTEGPVFNIKRLKWQI